MSMVRFFVFFQGGARASGNNNIKFGRDPQVLVGLAISHRLVSREGFLTVSLAKHGENW